MRKFDKPSAPLRIGILVTHQFSLNALGNFIDVLRLAGDDGDASGSRRCQYAIMSTTNDAVRASCGCLISPTAPLIPARELDYVAVVGGLLYRGRPFDFGTCSYLKEVGAAGTSLIGIGTGVFVLCRLGLMNDCRVCVSWFHYRDFITEFPALTPVADKIYLLDGVRVTTSGGVGAALTAAALVERHLSRDAAQKALRIMQIQPPINDLQPVAPCMTVVDDELVNRALLLMEQNLEGGRSIAFIAKTLKVTPRTLQRRFERCLGESPRESYVSLRLKHTQLLLRSGSRPIAAIRGAGFRSRGHFSRLYFKRFGRRPVFPAFNGRKSGLGHHFRT